MGMKHIVPKFWDCEWEQKTVLSSFGIGNRNEKQCSQPKLGKNGLKSLGKMLGTGIPIHACPGVRGGASLAYSAVPKS